MTDTPTLATLRAESVGIFVRLNADSQWGSSRAHPIGYVIQVSGCWNWVGGQSSDGYGVWSLRGAVTRRAHRIMYERHKGPIPQGLQLDHLCRNRLCVNPDHLEPVTNRENIL